MDDLFRISSDSNDKEYVAIDIEAARRLQKLMASQLEQVKQALECNEQLAKQLADLDSKSGSMKGGSSDVLPSAVKDACSEAGDLAKVACSEVGDLTTPLMTNVAVEVESEPNLSRSNSFERKLPPRQTAVFADMTSVKLYLQNTFSLDAYNVEDFYYATGFCQMVARDTMFKNLTLLVIVLNTIWIAIDTDYNRAPTILTADPIFQIAENLFCVYFSFEILTRFFAFEDKKKAFTDGWFVFDSTLVVLMVWETWVVPSFMLLSQTSEDTSGGSSGNSSIFRVMRLFRLMRASRVLRILRAFPELMIVVQAMLAAMRSVCGTLFLLVLVVYIFAILFTQLLRDTPASKGCFESVTQSMNCLVLNSVFPDQKDMFESLLVEGVLLYIINLMFMSISCLTVMNLLIGVLCDVVSEVSRVEKEALIANDLQVRLLEVMSLMDSDGNRQISHPEFEQLIGNKEACKILNDVGVDVYALVNHSEYIFKDHANLSFGEFIEFALSFRADNFVTVKVLADLRKELVNELVSVESRLGNSMNPKRD
eukprot:TRINITY_DN6927_c2_g1_i1.p1 TRINITY_DN6927_c2_g1~~TRINITY_DN6927_c2_g1_i1.p1  ORF type:complete len:560 (+),score=105.12 TRINITY_DN6927_c2_g1_i1:69-1682(+)